MLDYENLGAFYLGKRHDTEANKSTDDLVLYDGKDLTTHAVSIGMAGSGKTGLGVRILEEAAMSILLRHPGIQTERVIPPSTRMFCPVM